MHQKMPRKESSDTSIGLLYKFMDSFLGPAIIYPHRSFFGFNSLASFALPCYCNRVYTVTCPVPCSGSVKKIINPYNNVCSYLPCLSHFSAMLIWGLSFEAPCIFAPKWVEVLFSQN